MNWHYAYTVHIWPVLMAAALLGALGAYAWRRRVVPGALAFVALTTLSLPWSVAAALEMAATDLNTRLFWIKFETLWKIPTVTAALCFALEYANLGRWLTRRTIALLTAPALVYVLLALTNHAHHWIWVGFSSQGYVHLQFGRGGQIMRAYGYLLSLLTPLVFVWLFIRSPLHRWPAALCIFGQIVSRLVYLLGRRNGVPWGPGEATALAFTLVGVVYGLALFRFRLFDLIPIARGTMIEQMREGVLILDPQRRIIDLNPAAEKILGTPAASARGGDALKFLPMHCGLDTQLEEPGTAESEIHVGANGFGRDYVLHVSSLKNTSGFSLGRLVLFHDVTEQKAAQAHLLEQQRAVATLRERVRIGHELHDGVAQVLAYMKMQAEVAQSFLAQNRTSEANRRLSRLIAAAQDTHADVREYILGAGIPNRDGFLPALERYLQRFGENYGMAIELKVSSEMAGRALDPTAEVQLLRMIQEALTNVRKYAHARRVEVHFRVLDGHAEALIRDDGIGFDPASLHPADQKFGLRFMHERAEEIGGSVRVDSAPGEGTRIVICVPLRKGQS